MTDLFNPFGETKVRFKRFRSVDASARSAHLKLERLVNRLGTRRAEPRAVVYDSYRIGLLHAAEQMEMFWNHWQAVEQLRDLAPGLGAEVERVLVATLRSANLMMRRSEEAEEFFDSER